MPRPGDPDIIKRFAHAVADGHPVSTAATTAGIEQSTARRWLQDGEQELAAYEEQVMQTESDEETLSAEHGSHVAFYKAYERACADFVTGNLGVLNAAKGPEGKSWVPALALLKARRPKDFGDRQYSFVETKTEVNVTFSVEALSPARQRALAELALKSLPPGDVVEGEVVSE